MKKVLGLVLVLAIVLTASYVSAADEKGTPAEAQALVSKAVAYVKEVGREKALAEFNNPKGKMFVKKDLYIYVTSTKGVNLAHGATPALNGKEFINLKDADGKLFIKEKVEKALKDGKGQLDYRWTNPITKKVEAKSSYFERVDDMIITCGYYK